MTMGFFLGLVAGLAVGMLAAPASGKETRDRIKDWLDSGAREKAQEMGAKAGETAYEKLKQAV